ncbi:D-alanyl-D-alanine carboxypeptidase/D-alanyl-D-alanine-endopeptidase [Candidatus Sulfidibacterium hydrothermale]|uniref:D-alanyl-D-alanine carboxypeptidase/D-alanyl-D-alanine endopeptidase n=1 Tax=Candidatus Sulfidibacterium hydrothermale TaxID=2875962 RepID=UPI001F0A5811|nr:D-alanyl-D-alanine carboxypeptidase/D-alanyl-D-alanine-endopeptidase [Candidatus Sulfidibacterium hydrothermale]UBM61981.1 D-alanyl-D-alanine carboxypeptidase/D-alanyl-D-alanine-endopeptidase [Candidatus Sulfidibacterium hydrothermale]
MRKLLFFIALSFFFTSSFAKKPLYKKHHVVNKILKEVVNNPDFKPAAFAFLAIDGQTGEIIAQYHPDKALRPASNQKLISTATVLQLYGPDFRFQTKLGYTGHIDTLNHVLYGNIIIRGGGDPTLGSRYFEQTKNHQFLAQWVSAVKKLGIDSVAGHVIADAGIFSRDIVPVSWSWTNMGDYYGAGACGLTIFDNMYRIYFDSDSLAGDTVTIDSIVPQVPHLIFNNGLIADTVHDDESNILGAPYCNMRYLRGRIPLNQKGFSAKGSLPDPADYAAYVLEKRLQKSGIKIKANSTTVRQLLLTGNRINTQNLHVISTILSPPLSEIIHQTNIHSINLFAEHFLDYSGLKLIGKAQTEADAKAVMQYWEKQGMNIQGMALTDGSGLSQYNAVTPRQMVFLLNYMKHRSPYFNVYYQSLPLAGKSDKAGTLEGMFKGSTAENNLRAKSGTIDRVKAYSGYVTSLSGRKIIFSMMVNNFGCSSRKARAQLEKLMIALAELKK